MPRKTNLDYAEEELENAKADLEAFKATPEYAAAIKFRDERSAAQLALEVVGQRENAAFKAAGLRLGLFDSSDRGWTKSFTDSVSKAFGGMTSGTPLARQNIRGRRRKYYPFYDIVGRIGRSIIEKDPEYAAVHAEYNAAQKAVDVFWGPRYGEDCLLNEKEGAIQRAEWNFTEEKRKRNAYENRRRNTLVRGDAEHHEADEAAKAREQKVQEFFKTRKVPEELRQAYGIEEA